MKLKRKLLFSVLFSLFITSLQAQNVGFAWVHGLPNVDFQKHADLHTDADGSVFFIGQFFGTVDFDPSSAVHNLTAAGGSHGFILKLGPQGNFIWVKQFSGPGSFKGEDVTTDNNGNIYISGVFGGTLDFDPNSGISNYSAVNGEAAYILKLDSATNFIWLKQYSATDFVKPSSVAVDTLGNVYVTGDFKGTADFDPDTSAYNLTATYSSLSTFGDMFVQKLDSIGTFQWAIKFGSTSKDFGSQISVDPVLNVLVSGSFSETIDFDPGSGVFNQTASGLTEIVLLKLNPNGNFIWAKIMGGNGYDTMESMNTDSIGNIYSTGTYEGGSADFDPGPSTLNLPYTGSGTSDIFIQKLDSAGNLIWVKGISASWNQWGYAIDFDTVGNVYVAGEFRETVDFNPGTGTETLIAKGLADMFILKLDAVGDFVWVKQIGSSGIDCSTSMTMNNSCIFVTGYFVDTVDFDPSIDTFNLQSQNGYNKFLLKLNNCDTTYGVDVQSGCISYTWIDGNTYNSSNSTAKHTVSNAMGCDSIVTLNLTIYYPVFSYIDVTDCGPYTWIDGNTYSASTSSPSFTIAGGSSSGCDSIVTLNLTIVDTSVVDIIDCGPYTWLDGNTYSASTSLPIFEVPGGTVSGCDSILNLNLTIIDSAVSFDIRTECPGYTWLDGIAYNSGNNTSFIVLPGASAAGCDSTIFLNLSMTPIDVSISQTDQITLVSNATNVNYQWLNCNNNSAAIIGETSNTFVATNNGTYAVEITNTISNCADTSDCISISGLSLNSPSNFSGISVYPNPTTGIVNVEVDNGEKVSISVFNALGQLVYSKGNIVKSLSSFELNGAPGIYTLEVEINEMKKQYKIVLE